MDFDLLSILIPWCCELFILVSSQLLYFPHCFGVAASPPDGTPDVAFYFHKRDVQLCVQVCSINVMMMRAIDKE